MKEHDQSNLIKSIFTTEFSGSVKWIVSIALFVGGIVGPYYKIQTDIALIQASIANINTNHEAHIQDLTQDIKEIKVQQVDQQKQIIELQKQLIVVVTNSTRR